MHGGSKAGANGALLIVKNHWITKRAGQKGPARAAEYGESGSAGRPGMGWPSNRGRRALRHVRRLPIEAEWVAGAGPLCDRRDLAPPHV